MLSKRLYLILGQDNDLGNRLHRHYVYLSSRKVQINVKSKIDDIIYDYRDKKLVGLGFNQKTKKLLQELIRAKKEPGWKNIVLRILKGLSDLLEREIVSAKEMEIPKSIQTTIIKELKKLKIYHKTDLINIKETKKGSLQINYLSKRLSPKFDGKFKYDGILTPWRDTQMIFTLHFKKGLFVWDYINVHKSHHRKRIGTTSALNVEKVARKLGFKRFSVEYPNRKYWMNKLGYKIPIRYRIGPTGTKNYTHEGYKELK
ncbi:MAG: hypothetical protein ABIA62_00200 [Candidatus Woesearchaeota archaeon]